MTGDERSKQRAATSVRSPTEEDNSSSSSCASSFSSSSSSCSSSFSSSSSSVSSSSSSSAFSCYFFIFSTTLFCTPSFSPFRTSFFTSWHSNLFCLLLFEHLHSLPPPSPPPTRPHHNFLHRALACSWRCSAHGDAPFRGRAASALAKRQLDICLRAALESTPSGPHSPSRLSPSALAKSSLVLCPPPPLETTLALGKERKGGTKKCLVIGLACLVVCRSSM